MNKHLKDFLIGFFIGTIIPIFSLFVYWLFTWKNVSFIPDFFLFMHKHKKVSAHLALACIVNLPVFYIFLNKEKYKLAQGIIFSTIIYALYIFYYKLFIAGE
ncbi:MAG: hypothetical protein ACK5D5_05955 [Bacteroidota bacterium]|jgi:hypothetical protein